MNIDKDTGISSKNEKFKEYLINSTSSIDSFDDLESVEKESYPV